MPVTRDDVRGLAGVFRRIDHKLLTTDLPATVQLRSTMHSHIIAAIDKYRSLGWDVTYNPAVRPGEVDALVFA